MIQIQGTMSEHDVRESNDEDELFYNELKETGQIARRFLFL